MSLDHLRYTPPDEAGQWTIDQFQADVEAYTNSPYWQHQQPPVVLLRHLLYHLQRATTKVSDALEIEDHGNPLDLSLIISEVAPDLATTAAQLAMLGNANLGDLIAARRNQNMTRIEQQWAEKGINPLEPAS